MPSKFIDPIAIVQVIGCVYNTPQLLDYTDRYTITEEDFQNQLHQIIFGAIFKLHEMGAENITLENIDDFLASRPKYKAIYEQEKGNEWIVKAARVALSSSFDFYYNRLKKMSLLRAYDNCGVDVYDIFDPDNILDTAKLQAQQEYLDNASLEDIANKVDKKIEGIRLKYVNDIYGEAYQAGDGIIDLINRLKETPEVGVPLYGPLINTVTRGARLKKFYLRSAPSGCGKTRSMIADTCNIGCAQIYDEMFGWTSNGSAQPILYITTEQELEEVQTMMLAFLSCVDEEHILNGRYEGDEEARVLKAAEILANSPIYIEELMDFSLRDVEDTIRKNIREHDILYCAFDYIHSSLKIFEEINRRSGGMKLREDNVLFMLSARLKDLANTEGIFMLSATQLNGAWADTETPDQNLLRGSKAIADRIDWGSILLPVKADDIKALDPILSASTFDKPNLKMSIYKNRRGRFKSIYLWCKADLGVCRIKPMFATTYDYELVSINDLKIIAEEKSAF